MRLSTVIITHNRREALRHTLTMLRENPSLPHDAMETIVIDNGSTDDTAGMLRREHPHASVIRRERNEGVSARNHGFAVARGQYVMLCDDDSYPLRDAATRAMAHLDRDAACGAVGGRVELLDGRYEASALPGVAINCAVVLRKRVIDEVGGLPPEFFRQAEEYDWSFRIWRAGHRIDRFEDLVWRHNKAPGNRRGSVIHRYDVRNNLILLERYVPEPLREEYRRDWIGRYGAIARLNGHRLAHLRGRLDGAAWARRERRRGRSLLDAATIERLFALEEQKARVHAWAQQFAIGRVLLADLSKNVYATWRACRDTGLHLAGLADNAAAFRGARYRGLDVRPDAAWVGGFDGVVLSNVNPAQVERRARELEAHFRRPVLALWRPRRLSDVAVDRSAKTEAA